MRNVFKYVTDWQLFGVEDRPQSAKEMFINKKGDCEDHAGFGTYALEKNGYSAYGFLVSWGDLARRLNNPNVYDHMSTIFQLPNTRGYFVLDNTMPLGDRKYFLFPNYNFWSI
jgi:predicted transglutaminase-like cysteine proteinase